MCETHVNGATVIVVEHADQHPAGLLAEPAHVAVHQGPLELHGGDLAAPVGVNSQEPRSDLIMLASGISSGVVHSRLELKTELLS